MAAEEMLRHPEYGAAPVGFLDDDPAKLGTMLAGLPVLGDRTVLARVASEVAADELLIAIPSAPGTLVRALMRECEAARLPVKIVPGVREIILGDVHVNQIRRVRPEDLLGRESTSFDENQAREVIEGRRVLVTGAGGSVGADLCRQVVSLHPAHLVLLGRGENSVFEVEHELSALATSVPLEPIIADVRDRARITRVVRETRPDLVLHAAAHKHVHYMERQPIEAFRTNILGTLHLAEAARDAGASRFVMLSTDKAVHPTGVMGRSKRLAELVLQEMAQSGCPMRCMAVRFGNVLGSRGSVVPLFMRQIAYGGPVTISDPRATRYFMTVREASSLVLAAASIGKGGEVFVLDMGEPLNIADLARDLIAMACADGGAEVETVVTGLRPGEKLTETLWEEDEDARPTAHPLIRVLTAPVRLGALRARILELDERADDMSARDLAAALGDLVDSARP
jgi:FlaA1/EpsC-like NDP-sugar epimerase